MRIGVDCRYMLHPGVGPGFMNVAGVAHYVHHLVEALLEVDRENEYVLFFESREAAEAKRELIAGHPNARARVLPFAAFKKFLPFVHRHIIVSAIFEKEKLDLLHGPANSVPLFYRRPWIVTVHDLAIYDHPEWFPAGTLGQWSFATDLLVPHSIEHAARVIAVSETTKRDIARLFPEAATRIDVIPEGATCHPREGGDPEKNQKEVTSILEKFSLTPDAFALYVGTIEPRKNLPLGIRAFVNAVHAGHLPHGAQFAIAGKIGWKEGETYSAIAAAQRALEGTGARIRHIGYVTTEEKWALLSAARVFVFPTLFEGFGLPVLEAMSVGTPVVATTTSALRELCSDTALLVDPADDRAFTDALASAWNDDLLRARLASISRIRAASFTWQRAAEETALAYARATRTQVTTSGHTA